MRSLMSWQEISRILIAFAVIVAVTLLQKQSKLIAAITATMPVNVPLAMWLLYSATGGDGVSMREFAKSLVVSIFPTVGFLLAAWLASRADVKLGPTLLAGYAVWGVGVLILMALKRRLGLG
jgi:uncharacterized membrane protein (GlpM family)